jgi:3-hydroxybutyryl-CoA dehydrogenase
MQRLAVIGAGTMGAGIAQVAAQHGWSVRLVDVNEEVLRRGLDGIGKQLDRLVEKGKLSAADRDATLARIVPAASAEGAEGIELAIEAVVEDLAVKRKVFAALENAAPATAILATNTSSLSVTKIAEGTKHPERVVGMHFFNPAPVMPLVEIIRGKNSDPAKVEAAAAIARSWGKTTVIAKDTPGFIVNRVARGYYLEALRLLGEGVAGIDEIDLVMKRHGGFRMGPFELMDLVGLDVNFAVSTSVWEQMGRHPRFTPHAIQESLVKAGRLGRKTGRGFYSYEKDHPLPAYAVDRRSFEVNPKLADAMRTFVARAGAPAAGATEQLIFTRILAAIINEAGLALDEGVASAGDIDTAMIKGTNYPKGPLAWAEEIGPRTVRGVLRALNDSVADRRYEPARVFANAT